MGLDSQAKYDMIVGMSEAAPVPSSEFQGFVDAIRRPVYIGLLIAVPVFVLFNLGSIEGYFNASPAGATESSQTAPVVTTVQQGSNSSADQAPAFASVQTQAQAQTSPAQSTGSIALGSPFTNPRSVTAGEIIPFSFVITNDGSAAASYPYKVYVVWQNGEQDMLDRNAVSLQPGSSMTIPESLKFERATDTGVVYIVLQNTGQSIKLTMPAQS